MTSTDRRLYGIYKGESIGVGIPDFKIVDEVDITLPLCRYVEDDMFSIDFSIEVNNPEAFSFLEEAAVEDSCIELTLKYRNGKTLYGNFHIDRFEYEGESNSKQLAKLQVCNDGTLISR